MSFMKLGTEISTHTPHTGCDQLSQCTPQMAWYFNSHTPHGVRQCYRENCAEEYDFNSHTPHGVRLFSSQNIMPLILFQLTHPTRGATVICFCGIRHRRRFQLTHPTRGATSSILAPQLGQYDFNSHTPHGVRQELYKKHRDFFDISTHTPHTGCDKKIIGGKKDVKDFNSHTPHGVRQPESTEVLEMTFISTHTPHTGCDITDSGQAVAFRDFNSHTPHGVRHGLALTSIGRFSFQLTHPTRGATHHYT